LYACLDVRERGEFALGQIEGTTPLPRGTLEYRARTMVPSHTVPIVVCCDDGRRSTMAAATLSDMGYDAVSVLQGGLGAWSAAGLPTIAGWGLRGKQYAEFVALDRGVPHLSATDLAERRERGEKLVVIDVRTDEEYLRGHVPDAYHIPGGDLLLDLAALPESAADHTIVVSCAGRTRGILGAEMLRVAGFRDVFALENGGMGWRLAGRELEEGPGNGWPGRPSAVPQWIQDATDRLAEGARVRTIAVGDFKALRESREPFYAVDIRTPQEFRDGHVPGSISLPAGQFALQHENFLAVRAAQVVVIADDPIRPVWAAALCQDLGFTNVLVLDGGIHAWQAAGHTIDRGIQSAGVFGLDVARQNVGSVEPNILAQMLSRGAAAVLDVRGSGEFVTGHIAGSRWLARGKLELGIEPMVPDRTTPLIMVCDNGVRSTLGAATLRSLGYHNVRYLAGGIAAWQADNRALSAGFDGADVTREEAQADIGSTQWTGPLARTRADMEKYLADEQALARH
jgi:rhodanese-related sulfurtransferase